MWFKLEKMANTVVRWFVMYGFFMIGFWFSNSYTDAHIFMHELGHAMFGLGEIHWDRTSVLLDWPLASLGSLISTTAVAWAIAKYGTKLFPSLGLAGIGIAFESAFEIFFMDGGEFGVDIKDSTLLWYPAAIIALVVVIITYAKEKRRWQDRQNAKKEVHEMQTNESTA